MAKPNISELPQQLADVVQALTDMQQHGSAAALSAYIPQLPTADGQVWTLLAHELIDIQGARLGDALCAVDMGESNGDDVALAAALGFCALNCLYHTACID